MDKRLLQDAFQNKGPGKGRKVGDEYVITFADGKEIRMPAKTNAKVTIKETTEVTIEQTRKPTTKWASAISIDEIKRKRYGMDPREKDFNGLVRKLRTRKKKENAVVSFVKSLFKEDKS